MDASVSALGSKTNSVVQRARTVEPELRAAGATGLYLFGSASRGESTEDSDRDFFLVCGNDVPRDWGGQPRSLIDTGRTLLEPLFPNTKIDIVELGQMHKHIRFAAEAWSQRVLGEVDYAARYTSQERESLSAKDPLPVLHAMQEQIAHTRVTWKVLASHAIWLW